MGKKNRKHQPTHRCVERQQDYGIRYLTVDLRSGWYLMRREHDWDYDTEMYLPVAKINYCPFCGEELEDVIHDE